MIQPRIGHAGTRGDGCARGRDAVLAVLRGRRREAGFEPKRLASLKRVSFVLEDQQSICICSVSAELIVERDESLQSSWSRRVAVVRLTDGKGERGCVEVMEVRRTVHWTVPTTGKIWMAMVN